MNCETCQDRLMDLLYDEVRGPEADEARAHMEACPSCRASYEKLGMGQRFAARMPILEPSVELRARIMASAIAAAKGEDPVAAKKRDDEGDEGGFWHSVRRFLASIVMAPQVAMATVMMLVVAIGLWYVGPRLSRQHDESGSTVVGLDHDGEAGPSALEPAPALDLRLDQGRSRRARSDQATGAAAGGDLAEAQQPPLPAEPIAEDRGGATADLEQAQEVAMGPGDARGMRSRRAAPRASEPAGDVVSGPILDEAVAMRRAETDRSADSMGGRAGGGGGAATAGALAEAQPSRATATRQPARSVAPAEERSASREPLPYASQGLAAAGEYAGADEPAAAATPPPAQPVTRQQVAQRPSTQRSRAAVNTTRDMDDAAPAAGYRAPSGGGSVATSSSAGTRADYEQGMTRYRRRDYRGAIEELDTVATQPAPDASGLVPSAIHHLARSHRANGACAQAVRQYESLLSRFPTYPGAGSAMIEAADCYRRMGRLADARRWLVRAQSHSAVAATARREAARIDAMDRASRRPAAATAAEADVEAEAAEAPASAY